MTTDKKVRIELTAEQKEQVKEASGQEFRAIELNVEELEDRIAPAACASGVHLKEAILTH